MAKRTDFIYVMSKNFSFVVGTLYPEKTKLFSFSPLIVDTPPNYGKLHRFWRNFTTKDLFRQLNLYYWSM